MESKGSEITNVTNSSHENCEHQFDLVSLNVFSFMLQIEGADKTLFLSSILYYTATYFLDYQY